MTAKILLLLLCHAACAFFAGMETGALSCGRLRLLHLSRNGDMRAKLLLRSLRDSDRLLGTLLVGGNIASVMVSTLSASLAYSLFGAKGLGFSSAVSTATILVFGEYLPKAWFSVRPISRSLPFARILRASETLLWPLSRAATAVTSLMVPSAGGGSAKSRAGVSREHLRVLASNSEATGQISSLENLMIARALALQSRSARDIMVPASRVSTLGPESTLGDVARLVAQTGHGKFPVIDPASGKCLGVLHIRDVLARIVGNPEEPVAESMRKPFYIRASMRADDILPKMRNHSQRIAIVRDKAIPMLGIVTIDAILDAIAGDLPRDVSSERRVAAPAGSCGRAAAGREARRQ
ncbi:MAG: DUF21 domain-containing protein [Kiritimatiellae bacterium]|nr:DUF21 domain-containing protein [Kiritimatiellia bacterium]